ncbi:unnamed protein product [Leptidea sinapis]|uniref:Uncharacterized protein n=1 Tax=Leptidea sinapis TaxID=189913 RepID=A0A5E4Q853_9NEOP|nr:unnamed protein product [Leptidea sinapis]
MPIDLSKYIIIYYHEVNDLLFSCIHSSLIITRKNIIRVPDRFNDISKHTDLQN